MCEVAREREERFSCWPLKLNFQESRLPVDCFHFLTRKPTARKLGKMAAKHSLLGSLWGPASGQARNNHEGMHYSVSNKQSTNKAAANAASHSSHSKPIKNNQLLIISCAEQAPYLQGHILQETTTTTTTTDTTTTTTTFQPSERGRAQERGNFSHHIPELLGSVSRGSAERLHSQGLHERP